MSAPENPPAFLVSVQPDFQFANNGMSLRDYFAGQALAGFMASTKRPTTMHPDDAEWCYQIADAMLAARVKPAAEPAMQHVGYFDDGEFHWMSGIKPRSCELYAERAKGGAV